MRINFPRARRRAGLPPDFKMRTEADYAVVSAKLKEKIIQARRANDDENAAFLSEAKAYFKRLYDYKIRRLEDRFCPVCGEPKDRKAKRCGTCYWLARHHSKTLLMANQASMKEHVIETNVFIGPRTMAPGLLGKTVAQLAETGQVGDSFVTDRCPNTIKAAARRFGLEIIIRNATPGEKDKRKQKNRVWRSDGYSDAEINDIIQARLAGKQTPAPKPCRPLTTTEMQRRTAATIVNAVDSAAPALKALTASK